MYLLRIRQLIHNASYLICFPMDCLEALLTLSRTGTTLSFSSNLLKEHAVYHLK